MDLSTARGFEWDDANANKLRARHDVDSFECEEAFFNPFFPVPDETHSQQKPRFQALGITNGERRLFLVFTVRKDRIRVISARDMNKKERKLYDEKVEADSKIQE